MHRCRFGQFKTGSLINYGLSTVCFVAMIALSGGCNAVDNIANLPIETSFAFTNFSKTTYAALRIRAHDDTDSTPYFRTELLAPGATQRQRFVDALGEGCPNTLDLQVLIYERVNSDVPIGLDDGEVVGGTPTVAGEILDVPACGVQPLETYTIVSWDTESGQSRVKLAQDTPVDAAIRAINLFDNTDATWDVDGVDPAFASDAPPELATFEPIAGQVLLADGSGVEGVGVMLRTRFRVRLNDNDPTNDPDAEFGDPITFMFTDADGAFSFERPPGGYRLEFFSDDVAFRPAIIDVEPPIQSVLVVAEPI
ncbi:MAG: hypothetical protein DHS20C16_07470 [Phycisphaerae bacterium]|nr:MAG: hypothetical protein DHS20C16_07470 [Phycisphaerae bacterium]